MLRQIYQRCISLKLGKKNINAKDYGIQYIIHKDEIYRCLSSSIDIGQKRKVSSDRKTYSSKELPHLPTQSQIIIAGAGTVANSVAYHLVLNGWNDVLILEQNT